MPADGPKPEDGTTRSDLHKSCAPAGFPSSARQAHAVPGLGEQPHATNAGCLAPIPTAAHLFPTVWLGSEATAGDLALGAVCPASRHLVSSCRHRCGTGRERCCRVTGLVFTAGQLHGAVLLCLNTQVQAPEPHQAASIGLVAAGLPHPSSCHEKWRSPKPRTCRPLVPWCPGRALQPDQDPVTPNRGLAVAVPRESRG